MTRVIGGDACKKGWVGVTSDLRGYFGATIDQLVAEAWQNFELVRLATTLTPQHVLHRPGCAGQGGAG